MDRKRLALIGVLLAVAAGLVLLWRGIEGSGRTPASEAVASSTATSAARPESPLDVAPSSTEDGRSGTPVRISADARISDPDQSFNVDDAVWIEGVVRLPKEAPPDETLTVWAIDDESAEPFAAFGDLLSTLHEKEARFRFWSRRPVESTGAFRVPIPKGKAKASIALDGRFLFLDDPAHFALGETKAGFEIVPSLGAEIAGRCVLPPDTAVEDSAAGARVEFSGFSMSDARVGRRRFMVERTTRIGDDLKFSIRAVPVGLRASVRASPDRLATAVVSEFHLVAGKSCPVTLEFHRGTRVSGRVVDEAGAGLAATVRAQSESRPLFSAGYQRGDGRKATCAADGTYEILGVSPGKTKMIAELDGYVDAHSESLLLQDGARETVGLTLQRGGRLEGRVLWPDGTPAADAAILVAIRSDSEANPKGSRPRRSPRHESRKGKTDEQGSFTVVGLDSGVYTVTATAHRALENGKSGENPPEWRAEVVDVAAGTLSEPLVLRPPVGLAGRVVDDLGAPVKKFVVNARTPDDPSRVTDDSTWKSETFEQEDGSFLFPGLQAGRWKVDAEAEGYVASSNGPEVELPSSTPVVLTLARAGSAAGTVLDPDGNPVKGAVVAIGARDFQFRIAAGEVEPKTSDERGAFVIGGLPVGTVNLVATSPAWAPSELVPVLVAPAQRVEGLVLHLRRGGRLTGEVFDARGAHGVGTRVQVMSVNAQEQREAEVDADGTFELDHLAPGTYQVIAEPGQAAQEEMAKQSEDGAEVDMADLFSRIKMASAVLREGETTHVVLGAPPRAPVRVFGTVSQAGEHVHGGMVMCIGEGGSVLSKLKMGKVRDDGGYELVLDEPGDVLLAYQRTESPTGGIEFPVTIPEAKEHEVDLALPVGRLRGRVVAADGKALEGIGVEIIRGAGMSILGMMDAGNSVSTDRDGRFEFADLAPGTYGVAAGGGDRFGGDRPAAWGRVVRSGIVVAKDQVVDGIEIRLSAPGRITGIVRGPDGNPLPGASVFVRDERGEMLHAFSHDATDAGGRFECAGVAPGAYTLCARTKTLASPESTPVVVHEGVAGEVELAAGPGTILSVSIEDKDGKSLRASFTVHDDRGREVGALVGESGIEGLMTEGISSREKKVGPLPPGEYKVAAQAYDGRTANRTIQLRGGQDERGLKLRLE